MARVFRPTRKDRAGRTVRYERWYVEFADAHERTRRLPAFTDKRQSEDYLRRVQRLVALRINREQPDAETARWLDGLPHSMREGLIELGLLPGQRALAQQTLAEHVEAFKASILAHGKTEKHASLVQTRLLQVFDAAGCKRWADLNAAKLEAGLLKLSEAGASAIPVSDSTAEKPNGRKSRRTRRPNAATINHCVGHVRFFCKWMVRYQGATSNPAELLTKRGHVEADRRLVRRAFSADELRHLLAAAERGPERHGLSGAERALLYRLAVESGLRANELPGPVSFLNCRTGRGLGA